MTYKKLASVLFAFILVFSFSVALAQDDEQRGPSAEQIQQFEQEFGGPPTSFTAPEDEPAEPVFEEPGKIPDEAKKYVSDKDMVPVYCAMARWKTGEFFSAMDAVKKYVIPPSEQIRALGIDIEIPDIDGLIAQGKQRLEAICAAGSVDEADKLVREFASWGKEQGKGKFDAMRTDMQNKMKQKGDELRKKVQEEVDKVVAEEKPKIEAEIKAEAESFAAQKKSQLSGATSAPDMNAIKAEFQTFIQAKIAARQAAMKAKIQAVVDSVVGAKKEQFEAIGNAFKNVGKNIQTEIAARKGEYDQYKEEAFRLRKELVFKILDKNIEDGLKQLDAAKGDLENAKKNDPSIKNADEIRAALMQDRKELEAKLNAALDAGDETAFQAALNDFRSKWEEYRKEAEKAMAQGVSKACTMALAQFGPARTQMDAGLAKIKELMDKCAGSAKEECNKVNELSPRLTSISGKFADLKTEMALAEEMCKTPETADQKNLMALMQKIQADAEDAKTYGASLEAEKQKAIAESTDQVCAQVLPQLAAAKAEIEKNDLATLENNVARCSGKTTEECKVVLGLKDKVRVLSGEIKDFTVQINKVEALCRSDKSEENLQTMASALGFLKEQADVLKQNAKDLEVQQAEKGSEKAICRAVMPNMQLAKREVLAGLNHIREISLGCAGQSSEMCKRVASKVDEAKDIEQLTDSIFKRMMEITNVDCAKPTTNKPTETFLKKLEQLTSDQDAIKAKVKAFEGEVVAQGVGILIEAEDAVKFNQRLGVSNPMVREVNPRWRPPYSGTGDWYMGAGGDYLEYTFMVPVKGNYKLWVRDYKSHIKSQQGLGVKTISFNGEVLGSFPENTEGTVSDNQGAFHWHQVGKPYYFNEGQQKMKVVKKDTTQMAAVIDAFYLTTSDEVPAEYK
jgi:hypothetical protein